MMNNRKAVKWKGDTLEVLDTGDGQFPARGDGEPGAAVFDSGTLDWPSLPPWVECIAAGDERVELEECPLMNFFEP